MWVNSFSVCVHLDIAIEHMYGEAGDQEKPMICVPCELVAWYRRHNMLGLGIQVMNINNNEMYLLLFI